MSRDITMVELLRFYHNRTYVRQKIDRVFALKLAADAVALPARRQTQLRLDEHHQAEIVRRYQAGESTKSIALSMAITRNTVSAILERRGVPRRYRILDAEHVEQARQLYESEGLSLAAVGDHLGVNARTVQSVLREAGVQMRPVGTNQWS